MEIEDHIGDELVDHQSDSELTLKLNPMLLTDEPTSENGIRIVLQEGTQSNKIVPLDDKQISDLYNCLGIPTDESNTKYATWRLNVIHIRGVQEMNTNDVLEFFNDFEPDSIEWVNDLSCNVLFADNRAAATALEGLTVALIVHKSQDDSDGIPENTEVIDASEIEYSVPPGNRWKLGKSHDKAKYLLLRFATTADKKMPGARKHSVYYEKYGVPDPNERSEKVKEAPRISVSKQHKLRRNISRTIRNNELIEVTDGSILSMKMRADEEEERGRHHLDDRLGANVHRRIGSGGGFKHKTKVSVFDRLQKSDSQDHTKSGNRNNRTVRVSGEGGLRVFSRLSNGPRRFRSRF